MTVLNLLFVCTGNICRSPSAEFLLRTELNERLGDEAKKISISSAGLGTPGGWELDPEIARLLEGQRINGQEFRSRPVDADLLGEADLILTGTKQHRLGIGADFPDAYQRTFTMREAALLLARPETMQLPPYDLLERGRAAVALLQRSRGTRSLADHELDINDPHGRRTAAYEAMFSQVRGVVGTLAFVLAPAIVRGSHFSG